MVVVHGTYMPAWKEIRLGGLNRMSRNHMHFAKGYSFQGPEGEETQEVISGMRMTCDVFIEIDTTLAMRSGIAFYESKNGVILTEGYDGNLPPCFFKDVYCRADKLAEYKKEVSEKLFDMETIEYDHNVNPYETGPKLTLDLVDKNKPLRGQRVLVMRIRPSPSVTAYFSSKYFFVLDFEANCVRTGALVPQEIVEFPVVAVDPIKCQAVSDLVFHHYLKPKYHELTPFCTELTGITAEMLQDGISLEDSLARFELFLKDNKIAAEDFVFVTCGDWDLRTCLRKEAQYKKIELPTCFQRYINIKDLFQRATFRKSKKTGMVGMLNEFGLKLEGRHHSGIDDTKNIAKILAKILERGFFVSDYFVKPVKNSGKK